jgi:hypothetical protein
MIRTRILALACALVPAAALAAPSGPILSLRREIAALQLDRALDLTQPQAQALLPQLRDAQAKVAAWKSQQATTEPARAAALQQAVADLKANGAVSDSTRQALEAARAGAGAPPRDELRSIWQQARQVLTPDQLQALRTAKLGVGPGPSSAASARPMGAAGHGRFGRRHVLVRTVHLPRAGAGRIGRLARPRPLRPARAATSLSDRAGGRRRPSWGTAPR